MAKHRDPRIGDNGQMPVSPWQHNLLVLQCRRRLPPRPNPLMAPPPPGPHHAVLEPHDSAAAAIALIAEIAAVVRAGRARLHLSQRELARAMGTSQQTVVRLESGTADCRVTEIVAAFCVLDNALVVADPVSLTRRDGVHVRDQQGRRLPAHLEPYRLVEPHWWWPGQTDGRLWRQEPKWSYHRRP